MSDFVLKVTDKKAEWHELRSLGPVPLKRFRKGCIPAEFKVDVPALLQTIENMLQQSAVGKEKKDEVAKQKKRLQRGLRRFISAIGHHARTLSGQEHNVLIQSDDPEILGLLWELAEVDKGLPIGFDARWVLRRTSLDTLTRFQPEPAPLRILFFAASPEDLERVDYEKEEDRLLDTTRPFYGATAARIRFGEMGTFAELIGLVESFKPHVVHLSGHATPKGFAFENKQGKADWRDATAIGQRVFLGRPVSCVILNACKTAAPFALWRQLAKWGVPHVVGWPIAIPDEAAVTFTDELYQRLASGNTVASAVTHARLALKDHDMFRPISVLPQVHCSSVTGEAFDRTRQSSDYELARQQRHYLGDNIMGLEKGFVGRRKQIREIMPLLKDNIRCLVLHGCKGVGKSTLATRIANILAASKYRIIPVKASSQARHGDLASATFAAICKKIRKFLSDEKNRELPADMAPRDLAVALSPHRALLVLDNFEDVLDPDRIIYGPLKEFYVALLSDFLDQARCLITTQVVPFGTSDTQTVRCYQVPELDPRSFEKFLESDPVLSDRIGEIGAEFDEFIAQLHPIFGGNPEFWKPLITQLARLDRNEMLAEVQAISTLPDILEQREKFFEDTFVARLFQSLDQRNQEFIVGLAYSPHSLPLRFLTEMTGELIGAYDRKTVRQWLASAERFGLAEQVSVKGEWFQVPRLLQHWLLQQPVNHTKPPDLGKSAHRLLTKFWKTAYERDQAVLGLMPESKLGFCRYHADQLSDREPWRWGTRELASRLKDAAPERAGELLEQLAADLGSERAGVEDLS